MGPPVTTAEVPWPWPGDTELDKRTRICHDYRLALRRLDRDMCDRMDAAAHRLGQHWVAPVPATLDLEAMLPAAEMARYLHHEVRADQIRQWGCRGIITRRTDRDGHTVYRLGDIVDHLGQQRQTRAHRYRGPTGS
jgi:hypothetical protein